MKILFYILVLSSLVASSCRSGPSPQVVEPETEPQALPIEESIEVFEEAPVEFEYLPPPPFIEDLPVSAFRELWAYVISGEESALKAAYPLSDVAYFGAEVDSYGQLVNVPNANKIAFFKGRKHLVIACNSTALTHFVLEPDSAVHKRLVADLINATKAYDGLQIDFENIPARDGDTFRSFLGELKRGLGDKMLTIALKARTRTIRDDVYDYGKIKPLVDRILVMAYDEHWSSSAPGSIASLDWCRSIAAYAMETVGPEKLIMGLPFYGRTWGNVNTFRAFYYSGIERIKRENNVTEVRREKGIPTFSYEIPVTVTVYYEDVFSLSSRLELYRTMGVQAAGFWTLGQETPAVWNILKLEG
ncbi:hypothetical protein FACS1894141_0350 [Spirochaetia bacterium]|nr:hypothetical protein FACS1894141_0350 [Spirochaetia bacterium]